MGITEHRLSEHCEESSYISLNEKRRKPQEVWLLRAPLTVTSLWHKNSTATSSPPGLPRTELFLYRFLM